MKKNSTKAITKKSRPTKPTDIPESCASFSAWLRMQRDYSQGDLAKILNINRSAIAILETNRSVLPLDLMRKIYMICNHVERAYLLSCLHKDVDKLFHEKG